MRWKLVLVASLLAAVAGAGAGLGIVYGLLGSTRPVTEPGIPALFALLVPLAAVTYASLFVYRRTARRRALQAAAAALLAAALTLAALVAGSMLLVPRTAEPAPAPVKDNNG